jgi:hypothetical protein
MISIVFVNIFYRYQDLKNKMYLEKSVIQKVSIAFLWDALKPMFIYYSLFMMVYFFGWKWGKENWGCERRLSGAVYYAPADVETPFVWDSLLPVSQSIAVETRSYINLNGCCCCIMNSTIGTSIALLLLFTSLSSFAIVVNNKSDETTTDDYNNGSISFTIIWIEKPLVQTDSDTYRLYHRLFSKYNKFLRPVRNASTVTIVELNNQLRAILNTVSNTFKYTFMFFYLNRMNANRHSTIKNGSKW